MNIHESNHGHHEPQPSKSGRPNQLISMVAIYLYVGICAAEEAVDRFRARGQASRIRSDGGEPHVSEVCDPDGGNITTVSEN